MNTTVASAPVALPVDSARLAWLPVALFGSVMGLTGLAVAWRVAHTLFGTPLWLAGGIGVLALLAFVLLAGAYAVKAVTGFAHVRAEFAHPIASNLFGTPLISLLLIPLLLVDLDQTLARVIWSIGAVGMTVFAWLMVSRWISVRQKPAHATPAWIVPVVGMIDIPLALPALGWADSLHGLMVFATAVGLFFAIPLFTLILSRLMFEEPLPDALQPTLLILVAPFSVGFSAYTATAGGVDGFATALFMLALFVLAVLVGRLRNLLQCCPFKVSWWAVSFPLAASASAGLKYAVFAHDAVASGIAVALLALATTVIAGLTVRTVWGVARGELRALSS
ncbi:tellurite resistance protein [Silvimonas terrae]|uniref:Tellurite resistance protein n=1 Tax=Silvimonas terrae TaxID=300266 RepID=A0A840RC13_9NEIS|nr:SLAC1 anion channel family protein [Silvimonas terrae]MBB5190989.1 tellurite resistance protein [Silvimonas terrae]